VGRSGSTHDPCQAAVPDQQNGQTPRRKQGEGHEFAVQVLKTTSGEAGASGWVVIHESRGTTKELGFTLAVRLCHEDKAWSKELPLAEGLTF
jgi:hypothetical protein